MTRQWLDNTILVLMCNSRGFMSAPMCHLLNEGKYPRIAEYLRNRFETFDTYTQAFIRMKYGIEERNVCKVCGKLTSYRGASFYKETGYLYAPYCSRKCSAQEAPEKSMKTCREKYGVDFMSQVPEFRRRVKETCMRKYGVTSNLASADSINKRRETCKKKYGTDHPCQNSEVKSKIKSTLIEKHGVECGYNTEKAQEKMRSKESQEKRFASLMQHHTISTSHPEKELCLYMKEKFPDVCTQHVDRARYPWHCDFYIPSLDLFLELNGHWTHNTHPYDPYNIEDQKKAEEWKSKHTPYYDNAVKTWTVLDVKKRETAKKNNLYYKEVWTLEEGKKLIDSL